MTITFHLRGSVRIDWEVPHPEQFNFQMMAKLLRADGHLLADNIYINAADLIAIEIKQPSNKKVS
jgi:hypothetical protein